MTALREDPRRAGRYLLEVNGEEIKPISVEMIAEGGLRVGLALDGATLTRLRSAAGEVACFDHATEALARRARSRAGLERWLRQRGHGRQAIVAAQDRLERLGVLDDAAFAQGYARTRIQSGHYGPRRVMAELRREGVAAAVAEAAVNGVLADLEPEAVAARSLAAVERRARAMRGLPNDVARRRLLGWLLRRGHGGAEAARLVRAALDGLRRDAGALALAITLVASALAPVALCAQEQGSTAPPADRWKLNVASTLVGVPQVAWERTVADRRSIQVDFMVSPWRSVNGAPLQFGILAGEWRRHARAVGEGPYLGLHLGVVGFRLQKWDYRDTDFYQEGFGAVGGITVGYQWRLRRGGVLDLFVGGGTAQAKYKGYSAITGERYDGESGWNESGDWVPYRAGVMLSRR